MDNWIEFILERYNYWIVITLMMMGLYIVFARGNLVKKVVGLNLFQTSVFIFYITIGKIAGGTAPIYNGGELDHGGGHGEASHGGDASHGEAADAAHGAEGHEVSGDAYPSPVGDHAAEEGHGVETLHSTPDDSGMVEKLSNVIENDAIKARMQEAARNGADHAAEGGLHSLPQGDTAKVANDILKDAEGLKPAEHGPQGFDLADTGDHGADAAHGAVEAHSALGEVIYTNPLPHVLILTAIVVGVATTAVGLALAVRIREAYGTIEEDELETMDNVAEFGEIAEARAS